MEWVRKIAANLGELRFVGRISPYGINEPLLDGRIEDIVRTFRRACPGAFISFSTNGDLLNPRLFEALVDAGLDRLGISVYDDDTYRRLKDYTQLPNIRFLDMRKPRGKLENRGGSIVDNGDRYGFDLKRNTRSPCERPSQMMVIQADGNVALCCADMYGDMVFGDIYSQRLEEIWNGGGFSTIREHLRHDREGIGLCENCSHDGHASPRIYPRNRSLVDAICMVKETCRDRWKKIRLCP